MAELSQRLEPSQAQGLVAGTTPEVSLGQGGCPNDKLPVVPATKPAPGLDCVSLGQTDFGTDPIIVETAKQAEMDQRQKYCGSATRTLTKSGLFVTDPKRLWDRPNY